MTKAQADASVNGVFVVVADRCGVERGVDWIGGTLIAGPEGYLLAGPVLADHPALLVADCDLAARGTSGSMSTTTCWLTAGRSCTRR